MSTVSRVPQEPRASIETVQMNANSDTLLARPDKKADFIENLEHQMKELWSQYVKCLDTEGLSETAKTLRNKYYEVYRCYPQNKEWKTLINNN